MVRMDSCRSKTSNEHTPNHGIIFFDEAKMNIFSLAIHFQNAMQGA